MATNRWHNDGQTFRFRSDYEEHPQDWRQASVYIDNAKYHLLNQPGYNWAHDAITALIKAHVRINYDEASQ